MSGRFQKIAGHYADSQAGHGARQHPAMLTSHKRYELRQKGKIPPVDYRPLDEVMEALA